jgi:hypothetical protein
LPVKERLMILTLSEFGVVSLVALYLGRWMIGLRHRNAQSWESLIARLQHGWSGRELSEHFLWKEGLNATPIETWKRIHGVRGLCAMYKNARVMLEMADFADRNSDSVDPLLLETLRSDAIQIRACVMTALVQYALSQASESVRGNAFRASSMYMGMAARMTQLLQVHAAMALPEFVAAM